MSAKFPRRSFAAPLVVTLAVPACIVATKPAPAPVSGSVRDNRTDPNPGTNPDGTPTPPPPPIANPPPPDRVTPPAPPAPPPPRAPQPGNTTVQQPPPPTPPTTTPAALRSWTVFVGNDKTCYSQYDVVCPPKGATCNPPPPQKLASCPPGITAERPFKIKEETADNCALYYPTPDCGAGVTCNPPRPQKIACPTR